MADTAAPVPTPPEEENPFAARLQADPSLGEVSVTERVRLNFNDARYRGTLLGAGSVLKLPADAKGGQEVTDEFGNPIGTAPPSAVAADRYDAITADLLRYEATPSFTGAGEMTAALIGQLGGGMTSPEAFITRVPGLSSVVERFFPKAVKAGAALAGREVSEAAAQTAGRVASAGITQGAVQGAVNPAIQAAEMQSGLRDEFSKTETALAVGLGTLIGGGLGGAQEAVSALRARGAPPEAIASAEASAQFSDIVHAETAARERAVFAAEDPSMRSADTPDVSPSPQGVEPAVAPEPRPMDAEAVVVDPAGAASKAAEEVVEPAPNTGLALIDPPAASQGQGQGQRAAPELNAPLSARAMLDDLPGALDTGHVDVKRFASPPTAEELNKVVDAGRAHQAAEIARVFGEDADRARVLSRSSSDRAYDELAALVEKHGPEAEAVIYGKADLSPGDKGSVADDELRSLRDAITHIEGAASDFAQSGNAADLGREISYLAAKLPDVNAPDASHTVDQRIAVLQLARANEMLTAAGVDPRPALKAAVEDVVRRTKGDKEDAELLLARLSEYARRYMAPGEGRASPAGMEAQGALGADSRQLSLAPPKDASPQRQGQSARTADEDPLAALERGLAAGVADVKAGRPAPQPSTPYAPPPEQPRLPPAVPTPLEERVLRAVRSVGRQNDMAIDIYDVRALLPDVPRDELDRTLLSLQQKNLALLTQLSDPKDLRVRRKAGVDFGAGEQHVVSIQPDGKRALDAPRSMSGGNEPPALPQGAAIEGDSAHGPVLRGLENRWREAVAWLRGNRSGDARGVLSHPDVPEPIDVIWGDRNGGLQHIAEKHPEVLADLPERLAKMRATTTSENRIVLQGAGSRAIIRRDIDGDPKHWLLTAYEENGRRGRGTTERPTDRLPDTSSSPPPIQNIASAAENDKALIGAAVPSLPDHKVTTAAGRTVEVSPVVVEARELITSADAGFDQSVQPRQRDRAASQAQIREISTSLDPNRLGYSAEADRGAPIVGSDRMVESGNGRVLAIRGAYDRGGEAAARYRAWIEAQGVDVSGFKEPVLVRQRITEFTPEERGAFGAEANQAATLAMSAAERGLADARLISPEMLDQIRNPDDLGALANLDFRKAFVRSLPATEHGSMVAAGGELSSEGLTRIRNAVLARAYGNSGVLARIAEATSDDVKSISNALTSAAPEWAKLRSDIDSGRVRSDVDMTPALLEAVSRTAELRGKGQKLDTFLAQRDAFEPVNPAVEDWMRMFYDPKGRRAASAQTVAERLKTFAVEARKVSADGGLNLGLEPVTARELQALAATKGIKDGGEGQGGLQFRREPGAGSAGADGLQFRRRPGDGAGDGADGQGGSGPRGPGQDAGGGGSDGGGGGAGDAASRDLEPVLSLQQQAQALADALDVPLRQGRVQGGKTALGQYDLGQDVVRTKSIADFETVAHEAGHTLEKRIGPDLTKLIRRHGNELGPLDYDATRLDPSEGFSEWLRGALTNPAYGTVQAPTFGPAFREFMSAREPEMLAHLDAAAAAHQAWLNAPTDMKLEAIVRPPLTEWEKAKAEIKGEGMAQTVGLALQKIAAATYERIFDDKAPVARAVRSMVRSIRDATGARVSLQGGDNPEALARQFQRAQQAAVRDMLDGVRPYHGVMPEGPSLRDALITATGEPGILGRWNEAKVAAFDQYLVARRSEVLYGKVARGEMERRPLAMSAVDVSNAMMDAERANPGFREASEQIHAFTRQLLRKQYEGGLIDADLYARLMAEEFYVPMFRHMDDKPSPAGVGGSDGPGTVQTIKRMRGSDRDIIPPTQSLMTQAFLVNRTLAHNDIIKSFVQLARRAKEAGAVGTGRILEEIPATQMVGKKFDLAEAVASKAREAGMDRDDLAVLTGALTDVFGEDPLMATIFRSEPTGKRGEPLVFWKEGGQLRAVRLQSKDEGLALYETLAGLPPAARDMAIQLGVVTSQALRAGITSNPTFAITNFIRDQLAVGILRSDYVPFYSGAKGVVSEARQDQWAQLYTYAGGVSPGAGSAGLSELINRDIDALARKGWATQKVGGLADLQRGKLMGPIKAIAESVEIAESGARLAVIKSVFEQKKRQGLSDYDALIEAGYQATDLMDFGRHGSGTLYLRTLVPFLNAHLQGLDKARRTLVEPLWRAARGDIVTDADAEALRNAQLGLTKMLGVGGALGVGYGLWASSHEAYQDANVELRASHLIMPGSAFGREGKILVIPKPFELAVGFNLGEAIGTYMATKDPRSAHFAMEGLREVIQPPNPLTGIPIVKTTAELTLNKSFFTGRDIVPERLLNKENPRFETKPNTTALAKQIGNVLNISPIKVDYAVGSMFGNWGRDIMAVSNITDPNAPATSKEDQMFFRRFIKGADRTSETTRQWWEAAGRQNGAFVQANNRYGDLLKAFQDSQAADYLASLPTAQKTYVILNSAGTEDGKASFSSDDKRLNPLMRGANAVTVANDYIQELSRNAQKAYDGGERQKMDPNKRRDVIEGLRVLSAMEQRNALVMLKQKGYEGRPLLSVEDQFKVLSAISPEAGEEIATRYATAKILPTATVARLWPEAEKRLLADGGQAELRELSSDAKADGYAFGGERVKKPQKRRVVIDPSVPTPPAGRVPALQPNPFQ